MCTISMLLSKIDSIREPRGLSVYKLTELSGLSETTIYSWYTKGAIPSITALISVCNVLEITLIKSGEKNNILEAKFQEVVKQKRAKYNALLQEHEKERHILTKLIEEIGRAMIGESRLSLDVINQSVSNQKEKIAQLEKLIPRALKEVNDNQGILKNLDTYYERFLGWAEEFDEASHKRKNDNL